MGYDRDRIIERDDYECQKCGKSFDDGRPLEVSHRVPRHAGGPDDDWNLEALCIACHSDRDGWEVGDFGGQANRVVRVASYVSQREHLSGAAFLSRVATLLGVDSERAKGLLDQADWDWR